MPTKTQSSTWISYVRPKADAAADVSPRRRTPVSRQASGRRGMALAAALICLLVVMLFAAAVVQGLVTRQRSLRTEEQQIQCLLLTESAVDRAKARLQVEPEYSGETWTVSLDDRGVVRPGLAHIRVEPVVDESTKRQIDVEVYWPDDPVLRIRRVKQITVTLPVSGTPS